jgi:beta-lactamase superfamily II metal-dependent hydrolase
MSDAGVVMENNLLKTNPEKLPADILVFGRHGNDIFATSAFLAAVQPKAIILAAPDPFSEGIDEGSLRQRLRASGAKLFHQEKCGAVIITWKSGEAEIHGFIGQESISLPFYPQRN